MILFKNKGLKTEIKNYKPLSIINIDYKLFTNILMQRLIEALNKVITSQQAGFLSKRLINNNIKTVQYLIARHGSDMKSVDIKDEITLLFLNQEKVYNRINHEYLKGAMR